MRTQGMLAPLALVVSATLVTTAISAQAAPRGHHGQGATGAPGGPPPSADALAAYVAPFSWGMTFDDVKAQVTQQIKDAYAPKIAAQTDIYHQDQVRVQMQQEIDKFARSYAELNGGHSDWESSIVAREISQKDHEALAVQWQPDQRKFFFFVDGKLWKIFIAFNSEKFPDKTFHDFQQVLEAKFASSAEQPVIATDARGKAEIKEVAWPASGGYVLRGIDETGFYGNFCLAIENPAIASTIATRRTENAPAGDDSSFVDSVIVKPKPEPAPAAAPAVK